MAQQINPSNDAQIQHLTNLLTISIENNARLEEQNTSFETRLEEIERTFREQVDALTAGNHTLVGRVTDLSSQIDDLTSQVNCLTAERDTAIAENRSLREQMDTDNCNLTGRITELNEQVDELSRRCEEAIEERNILRDQVNDLTAERDNLRRDLNAARAAPANPIPGQPAAANRQNVQAPGHTPVGLSFTRHWAEVLEKHAVEGTVLSGVVHLAHFGNAIGGIIEVAGLRIPVAVLTTLSHTIPAIVSKEHRTTLINSYRSIGYTLAATGYSTRRTLPCTRAHTIQSVAS